MGKLEASCARGVRLTSPVCCVQGTYDRMYEQMASGVHPIDILLLWAAAENDTPKVAELLRAGADNTAKVRTAPQLWRPESMVAPRSPGRRDGSRDTIPGASAAGQQVLAHRAYDARAVRCTPVEFLGVVALGICAGRQCRPLQTLAPLRPLLIPGP